MEIRGHSIKMSFMVKTIGGNIVPKPVFHIEFMYDTPVVVRLFLEEVLRGQRHNRGCLYYKKWTNLVAISTSNPIEYTLLKI